MKRLSSSLRTQLISLIIISLLVLAGTLEVIRLYQEQSILINSERRIGLTLIQSVNTTINSVRSFITTLSDAAELGTRLTELVQFNQGIAFIAVADPDGRVIFHSNGQYQGKTISELALLPANQTISKTLEGYNEVLLTSITFDSSDLTDPKQYVIIVASAAAPIRSQLTNNGLSAILVTVLFAAVAAVVVIAFIQRFFVNPLEQLTRAANAIESGDLSVSATVSRNNEIGQLARSFNSMTQQLTHSISTLEERVKERTFELEIARDQAEQASRAKSDFLSNMSHELRTPLNMVIGYTSSMLNMPQMYNNVPLPEVFRPDIELIRDSGKHLLTLINDILDLSKVEAGKLQLNFSAVNMNTTLDGVVAASLGLIGDKPLQLRQHYPEDLPHVWADPVRVRQILLNLLSNAIKFTQSGSVTLSAELRGQDLCISVADTGPGIPESAMHTIFDRFEQYQHNTDVQGTGLGLDISQRLAQLHGSKITIQSTVGVGSIFAFSLRIASEEQFGQDSSEQAVPGNAEILTGSDQLQLMILLIATEPSLRQSLRSTLEQQGTVVIEANDANQAIELASGLLPDAILLDTEAHQIDYRDILAKLQADRDAQHIPVVLMQRSDSLIKERDLLVLYKPIQPAELIRAVQKTVLLEKEA